MSRRSVQLRAKAKTRLMVTEQVKRGEKFYIVLDQESSKVTLLDSWENTVLALCNGENDEDALLQRLSQYEFSVAPTRTRLRQCLSFFESHFLIEPLGLLRSETVLDDPRSMAEVQLAFQEWHKQPSFSGELPEWEAPWSDDEPVAIAPSMEPTRTEIPVYNRDKIKAVKSLNEPGPEALLNNPPVPRETMTSQPTEVPASSLNANTAAHRVFGAMEIEEDSDTDERSQSDLVGAIDGVAPILKIKQGKTGHPRVGDLEEDATLQIRTRSSREPSDRMETFIAPVRPPMQRMETLATKPATLPVFPEWVGHVRKTIRQQPLGSSVTLHSVMSSFPSHRLDALMQHTTSLSALLSDKTALKAVMAVSKGIKAGHKNPTTNSHDAAVILTSILRSGRSAGICVACLKQGRKSSTSCKGCGFRSLMIRDD